MKKFTLSFFLFTTLMGCQNKNTVMQSLHLKENAMRVRDYVVENAVIAHRGSTYWVPEETEEAYRWARNIGADYLEVDLQRSKDGVLLALHDNNLDRTTDFKTLFPNQLPASAGEFTYEELMRLDAGNWFTEIYSPNSGRDFQKNSKLSKCSHRAYSFSAQDISKELNTSNAKLHSSPAIYVGGKQYISTLEDVIMIAKGWRIARDAEGNRLYEKTVENGKTNYLFYYVQDSTDKGHRPGVYLETKEPELYPNVEKDLYEALAQFGWNIAEKPEIDSVPYYVNGYVNTANTNGKVVLQTFSPSSLINLSTYFKGKVPVCFLLWLGDKNLIEDDTISYQKNINFAIQNNAHFIGPSIGGAPNNYADLLKDWQAEMIHASGLKIHGYSFDTEEQTKAYFKYTDAMFTNRSELTIRFFKKQGLKPDLMDPSPTNY